MCFQTIKEWIELIESLVVIAAAGVAIWAALGWRRDFLSRRRLEIREDVLTKMQELKALLLQVNGGLRYIEHLEPEPEVGESTVALRLDVEEVVKEHQLVLAKFDEIKVLELKARLLFEPKEIDAFRHFAVARVSEFTKINRVLAHVQMLDHVLREADQFNANLVTIAEQVRERVARLFESTEDKPHSLEAMSIAIDGFCVRLSFRPAPKRLFEKWTVKKNRERIKK